MIDKLDLRVPSGARFSPEFGRTYSEVRRGDRDTFRQARLYESTGDLRPYGYPAIIHLYSRFGQGNHKLEMIDTGGRSYAGICSEIERIFEVDPKALGIMRLDLAADVQGVPVHAFVGNVRAKFKRSAEELGRYSLIGKRGVETFYLGRRPNLFRFYDKMAELHHQYSALKRQSEGPLKTFAELFGYAETGPVLTRVERQIGGSRVPPKIATVGQLVHLPDFDPFDRLEVSIGSDLTPDPRHYRFSKYLQLLGLAEFVRQNGGVQSARRLANQLSTNASRLFEDLPNFLPCSPRKITEKEIFECYRKTVSKQLAA